MKPRWQRRLDAARTELLKHGDRIQSLLQVDEPIVHETAVDLLVGVGWREKDFYNHYFDYLMRENRRG